MTTRVILHGGPLNGQQVTLHPVQEQDGRYGILVGRGVGLDDPAYTPDGTSRWTWQGKPGFTGSGMLPP